MWYKQAKFLPLIIEIIFAHSYAFLLINWARPAHSFGVLSRRNAIPNVMVPMFFFLPWTILCMQSVIMITWVVKARNRYKQTNSTYTFIILSKELKISVLKTYVQQWMLEKLIRFYKIAYIQSVLGSWSR